MWRSDGIGCWCGVRFRSAGGIWVMAKRRRRDGWTRQWRWRAKGLSLARQLGGGKNQKEGGKQRPQVCWPAALRKVRAWLEPWLMLVRCWRRSEERRGRERV